MATIAVITSAPPLTEGGHLVHARALVRALEEAGHRAGLVTTPSNRFGRQATAYLANWCTDVGMTGEGAPIDQVISIRFPSYVVRHPRHVSWLNHTMREYYDLWDTFSAGLSPQGRLKEGMRKRLIRAADTHFLRRATKVFAVSAVVRERLLRWNRVPSEVLHVPPPPRPYRCDGYGDYLFFASRLAPLKRADLAIQALARPAAKGAKLVIGGDGEERPRLQKLTAELGLEARVTFTGQLSEAALVDHLARCRAVVFVPKSEDYGFVTVEAFAAGKAVITCTDSGGPTELVTTETGRVVAPDPAALATSFAELSADATLAEALGQRAKESVASLTWPAAVERLVLR